MSEKKCMLRLSKVILIIMVLAINSIAFSGCDQSNTSKPTTHNNNESDVGNKEISVSDDTQKKQTNENIVMEIEFMNTKYSPLLSNVRGIMFIVKYDDYDKQIHQLEVIISAGSLLKEDDDGQVTTSVSSKEINANDKVIWSAFGDEMPDNEEITVTIILSDQTGEIYRSGFIIEETSEALYSIKESQLRSTD